MSLPDPLAQIKSLVASGKQFTADEFEALLPEEQEYLQELKREKRRQEYADRKAELAEKQQRVISALHAYTDVYSEDMERFHKDAKKGKYLIDVRTAKVNPPDEWQRI